MRLFGFEVTRTKRLPDLRNILDRGWSSMWIGGAQDPFNFQRDIHCSHDTILSNWTVFACMTLIAGDVGKMRIKLLDDLNGIPEETTSPAFSPVLRKPNAFQTRQKFIESWIFSKLSHGNTYVLKERDNRGVVVGLYVLDPQRVRPMVSPNGSVYYQLQSDILAGVPEDDELPPVPASEIIHDRMWCIFHPLEGLSPIYASGLAASQGLKIQANSASFFANMSRPSGILSSALEITDDKAAAYKQRWEENYGAGRVGKTAVLGGGLEYKAVTQTAHDSQMVEQLQMSAQMICSTFHVPPYKVGVGPIPPYQQADVMNQIYYDTCLQPLIEAIEAQLDEGLGLPDVSGKSLATELDLDALLRMDRATQVEVLTKETGAGITSPNEARAKLGMQPVDGGESPLIQQQNYSLPALKKRDEGPDPFGKAAAAPAPGAPPASDQGKEAAIFTKALLERLDAELVCE